MEKPIVKVIRFKAVDVIATSRPGWGPDKGSDRDGHDMPPGQIGKTNYYEPYN